MCANNSVSPIPQQTQRKLTLLVLDCWQREYDKRPYRHFQFDRLILEERLNREYVPEDDFSTIVLFLTNRLLCSMKLVGLRVTADDISLVDDFVRSLQKLSHIELLLMDLPTEFFQLLALSAENMKVMELSLQGTPLKGEDIFHLHSFLIKCPTLSKLNVCSCSIDQYNFAHLADGIYKSTALSSCNLSHLLGLHLTLDSHKIAHVVSSLIWQNKLQELVLENCGFMGQDMEIIAEYLYRKCSKLQTLNVSYNKIGSNGALELLKAISSSETMKHLKMNGCSLTTHGGEMVAQYLSSCWSLHSLELQRNNIGAEAVNKILLCVKKACHLRKLYLFGNLFNKDTGDTLRSLLDSEILLLDNIDIALTFDDTLGGYRVVPCLK